MIRRSTYLRVFNNRPPCSILYSDSLIILRTKGCVKKRLINTHVCTVGSQTHYLSMQKQCSDYWISGHRYKNKTTQPFSLISGQCTHVTINSRHISPRVPNPNISVISHNKSRVQFICMTDCTRGPDISKIWLRLWNVKGQNGDKQQLILR